VPLLEGFIQGPISVGVSWLQCFGSVADYRAVARIYKDEKFLLNLRSDGGIRVVLLKGSTVSDVFKAYYNACLLDARVREESLLLHDTAKRRKLTTDVYKEVNSSFEEFMQYVEEGGWDTSRLLLPRGSFEYEMVGSTEKECQTTDKDAKHDKRD